MSVVRGAAPRTVRSLVPARMDRLPWTRFHWLVIIGLGLLTDTCIFGWLETRVRERWGLTNAR